MARQKHIYLDYAAATPINPLVLKSMRPFFMSNFANPDSTHTLGKITGVALKTARQNIAKTLNCLPEEIIFTSGGTESNNLSIIGAAMAYKNQGNEIITSKIEHSSVLQTCKYLETQGFIVHYISTDRNGALDLQEFKSKITEKTILASVMMANNEIGTIQDLEKIGAVCKKHKIILHSDACQALNYLEIETKKLSIDLLSFSGSKIYGPKGIGAIYKKSSVKIAPQIHGGGQEFDLRSGTPNIPGIIGFEKALILSQENQNLETTRILKLKSNFIDKIKKSIPTAIINADIEKTLPNIISLTIPHLRNQLLLNHLNNNKIYCSTGSACLNNKNDTSHVLKALGLGSMAINCTIRISMGHQTTQEDMNNLLKQINQLNHQNTKVIK